MSPIWIGVSGVMEAVEGNPHSFLVIGDTKFEFPILDLIYTTVLPSVLSLGSGSAPQG